MKARNKTTQTDANAIEREGRPMTKSVAGKAWGRCAFAVILLAFGSGVVNASDPANETPYIHVLGVAQDAGYPQAGCFKPHCMPGWENPERRRSAVSLGLVVPSTGEKFLFEATPQFPAQFYQLDKQAPSKAFELGGIFLTHAHIGHYTGLMFLGHEAMGASGVSVYAMPRMREFLASNGPWEQIVDYGNIVLRPLEHEQPVKLGPVTVTPFLVPHRDEYSETVGYRIEGPQKAAVFIPDIDKWSEWDRDLAEVVGSVDYALVDATFFADGELPGRDMSAIPHPFVSETMDLLDHLPAPERNKVWFIHMNHTNPLLKGDSKERALVESKGYNVADEGTRLPL